MRGITFSAWREGRYIGLSELLLALGYPSFELTWRLHIEEVSPHPMAEQLEAAASSGKLISTLDLLHLTTPTVQIIDGIVMGYDERNHDSLQLLIRAVDSSDWDVESEREDLLVPFKVAFPDATPLPT